MAAQPVVPTPAQITAAVLAYAEAAGDSARHISTAEHLHAMRAALAAALNTKG